MGRCAATEQAERKRIRTQLEERDRLARQAAELTRRRAAAYEIATTALAEAIVAARTFDSLLEQLVATATRLREAEGVWRAAVLPLVPREERLDWTLASATSGIEPFAQSVAAIARDGYSNQVAGRAGRLLSNIYQALHPGASTSADAAEEIGS